MTNSPSRPRRPQRPSRRLLSWRAMERDVSERFNALFEKFEELLEELKEVYHPHSDVYDYVVPCSLQYALSRHSYAKDLLVRLIGQIRDLEAFLKLVENYFSCDGCDCCDGCDGCDGCDCCDGCNGCDGKLGYGINCDPGGDRLKKPMMALLYHLEVEFSKLFTEWTPTSMVYCLHIHYRLVDMKDECDLVEIGQILTHYFNSLNDPVVQLLVERDFLSHFVKELVNTHFAIDEFAKMRYMLYRLYGKKVEHLALVRAFVMHSAFDMPAVEHHNFAPGPTTTFYQSIVADFRTSIKTPTDQVVRSLVSRVVMGLDIGLDEFCRSVMPSYLPDSLPKLAKTHEIAGVGVEYLQTWMSLLESRLSIATTRRDLSADFN